MALKPCRECKKEISTDAKTCPHCEAKDPNNGKFKAVILLIAILAVAAYFLGPGSSIKNSASSETVTAPVK